MNIKQTKPLEIEVILSWDDWKRLEKGEIIGDRYNGENKLLIYRIYPCDPNNYESKLKSFEQKEYVKIDRRTMDIDIYIPTEF